MAVTDNSAVPLKGDATAVPKVAAFTTTYKQLPNQAIPIVGKLVSRQVAGQPTLIATRHLHLGIKSDGQGTLSLLKNHAMQGVSGTKTKQPWLAHLPK